MEKEKPTLHLLHSRFTAEDASRMLERLTGKKMSDEEIADFQARLNAARDKQDGEKL